MAKSFVKGLSCLAALVGLWLGSQSPGRAGPLTMSFPEGQFQVTGFAFAPGNLLYQGLIPVSGTPLVGQTFEAYFQANMGALLGTGGLPIGGLGLNSTYQLTVVARFTEVITSISSIGTGGGIVSFC
jgi:hypothetical protein